MTKFYSKYDEFSNDLYADLSWRKHELSILKNSIPESSNKKQQAFLRMAIPILYAHWEGFVNVASVYYLKYVKSKRLKHSELQEQFIALSLKNKLNLYEIKSIEKQTEIVNFLLNNINERSNIPLKNIINTKSNLNFKVFNEVIFILGLDKEIFKNFESVIEDLIKLRNFIAHGENNVIDIQTFNSFYDELINLMDLYKSQLETAASNENYKKQHTTMAISNAGNVLNI